MNEFPLRAIVASSADTSAATAALLIHVVTLMAKQPGFDRNGFIEALQSGSLEPDTHPAFRQIYEGLRDQIVGNLRSPEELPPEPNASPGQRALRKQRRRHRQRARPRP